MCLLGKSPPWRRRILCCTQNKYFSFVKDCSISLPLQVHTFINYVFSILEVDVFNKVFLKNTWTKTEITFISHLASSGICKLKCLVKLISQTQSAEPTKGKKKNEKKKYFKNFWLLVWGAMRDLFLHMQFVIHISVSLVQPVSNQWAFLSYLIIPALASLSYTILWTIFYGSSKSSVLCKLLIGRNFKDKWIVVILYRWVITWSKANYNLIIIYQVWEMSEMSEKS